MSAGSWSARPKAGSLIAAHQPDPHIARAKPGFAERPRKCRVAEHFRAAGSLISRSNASLCMNAWRLRVRQHDAVGRPSAAPARAWPRPLSPPCRARAGSRGRSAPRGRRRRGRRSAHIAFLAMITPPSVCRDRRTTPSRRPEFADVAVWRRDSVVAMAATRSMTFDTRSARRLGRLDLVERAIPAARAARPAAASRRCCSSARQCWRASSGVRARHPVWRSAGLLRRSNQSSVWLPAEQQFTETLSSRSTAST